MRSPGECFSLEIYVVTAAFTLVIRYFCRRCSLIAILASVSRTDIASHNSLLISFRFRLLRLLQDFQLKFERENLTAANGTAECKNRPVKV